jgi:6-phosphogluconolactonase (cycloisomerase 2 family)
MKTQVWFRLRTIFLLAVTAAVPSAAQVVAVTSPVNNSQVLSPVHYVASATSLQCSKGITDMSIYIASHVVAYNVHSESIDTHLSLTPGTYKTVVQAWDACGGVNKTPVNFTVTAPDLKPVRFLYIADKNFGRVLGFTVDPSTGVPSPTAQASVSISAGGLASDTGGYRLYLTGPGGVYGYFINRTNGNLSGVPGSPVAVNSSGALAVHPSGKFVFAATLSSQAGAGISTLRVNSDGSLTSVNPNPVPAKAYLRSVIADRSGKYLYALSEDGNSIDAYAIDSTSGDLTPLPGSPYLISTPCNPYPILGADTTDISDVYGRFLYVTDLFGSALSGYAVSGRVGTLTELTGSPFPVGGCPGENPLTLSAEPTGRFLYVGDGLLSQISLYLINAGNGVLTHVRDFPFSFLGASRLRGDPSGKFLYIRSTAGYGDHLEGLSIDPITGYLTELPASPFSIGTNVTFYELVTTP